MDGSATEVPCPHLMVAPLVVGQSAGWVETNPKSSFGSFMGLSWMIYVHQHSEFLKIFAGDLADWSCLDELLLVDERGVKPCGSHIFSHGIHTFVVVKFAEGASSLWLWHILNMLWRWWTNIMRNRSRETQESHYLDVSFSHMTLVLWCVFPLNITLEVGYENDLRVGSGMDVSANISSN